MPRFLGAPLAALYGAVIARRNARFDAGKDVIELDRPVISIGNLSVGGTGKTPMVLTIAQWLRETRHWPCVAMRGYAAGGQGSDEAREYQRAMADLPVVVGADRTSGLIELFAAGAGARVDCVLLDDGFQHRRISRQLDIVLIDATRSPFEDRLLPHGWLREPVQSLERAQAIVLTHAEVVTPAALNSLRDQVLRTSPRAVLAVCAHVWGSLSIMDPAQNVNGSMTDVGVGWLHGKSTLACCAIGSPRPFLDQVAACGARMVESITLKDHDEYAPRTIASILARATKCGAQAVVVTRKDWVKLARVRPSAWPCPVVVPELRMAFLEGEAQLRELIDATCVALGLEHFGSDGEAQSHPPAP